MNIICFIFNKIHNHSRRVRMHKECMNQSNYFGGGNFPSNSTLQYPFSHTDIHGIFKKRVVFAKFSQFPLWKHLKFSSSVVTGPKFVYSICRGLKQFFNIVFIKSCIFCKVWTLHCNWFALYCQMFNIQQSRRDQQTKMVKRWAGKDAGVKWGGCLNED